MKANKEKNKSEKMSFIALNPYTETNIVKPTEGRASGSGWVAFGDRNLYPNYVYNMYENCATLKAIIDGCISFTLGNEIASNAEIMTQKEAKKLVEDMAQSILIYGGVYVSVLRNKMKQVCKLEVLDYRCVRSDEKNDFFYYSKDFADNKSYGRCKSNVYPKFDRKAEDVPSSIFYYKNRKHFTYGLPIYNGVLSACEIEKSINEYHLNSIKNGFSSDTLITLLNGIPSDEIRDEIEDMFNEKFSGESNAGRIMINFAPDKDHSVQVDKIEITDFAEKHDSMVKRSQQQIFTAFSATPILFGVPMENIGFNNQEYNAAYALFYRNKIKPLQENIVDILDEILGIEGSITIEPFAIDFEAEEIKVEEVE